jgi:hypothetical protein
MQKLMLTLLVGIIALAPAIAAAQTGGGTGSPGSGSSTPSGTTGGSGSGLSTPGSSSTPGSGSTTAPGSSSSPSASPSGTGSDLSKITSRADCERAGGMWSAATNKCDRK